MSDELTPDEKLRLITQRANEWLEAADAMGLGLVLVACHPVGRATIMCNVDPALAKKWLRDAASRPIDSFAPDKEKVQS